MVLELENLAEIFKRSHTLQVPHNMRLLLHDRVTQLVASQRDSSPLPFRASKIGKPWVLQCLDRAVPRGAVPSQYLQDTQRQYAGYVAQAQAQCILESANVPFETEQYVEYRNLVGGHYDFLLQLQGKRFVCDVKCMSEHLSRTFRSNPNDDYGYLSQLAFYWKVTGADGACFLIQNRNDTLWYVVPVTEHALQMKWQRIETAIDVIGSIPVDDIAQLLQVVEVPPPQGGRLPFIMDRSRWRDYLYSYTSSEGYTPRHWKVATEMLQKYIKEQHSKLPPVYEQLALPLGE